MIDPIRNPVYQDYQRLKQSKKIDGANTEKGKFNLDYAEEGVLYEPSSEEKDKTDETAKKQAGSFQAAAADELRELTESTPAANQQPASAQRSLTDMLRAFATRALQALRRLWAAIWESRPANQDASVLTKEEFNDAETVDGAEIAAESRAGESDGSVTLSGGTADNPAAVDGSLSADETAGADRMPSGGIPNKSASTPGNTTAGNVGAADAMPNGKTASAQDPLHAANDARILHALKSGDRNHFRSLLSEDGRRTPARNSSLLTYYDAKGNLISPDASVQQRVLHGDRGSLKR